MSSTSTTTTSLPRPATTVKTTVANTIHFLASTLAVGITTLASSTLTEMATTEYRRRTTNPALRLVESVFSPSQTEFSHPAIAGIAMALYVSHVLGSLHTDDVEFKQRVANSAKSVVLKEVGGLVTYVCCLVALAMGSWRLMSGVLLAAETVGSLASALSAWD